MSRIKNPKAKQARLNQSAADKADRDAGAWERVSAYFQQQQAAAHAAGLKQGMGVEAWESLQALANEVAMLRGFAAELVSKSDVPEALAAKLDAIPRAVLTFRPTEAGAAGSQPAVPGPALSVVPAEGGPGAEQAGEPEASQPH